MIPKKIKQLNPKSIEIMTFNLVYKIHDKKVRRFFPKIRIKLENFAKKTHFIQRQFHNF